MQLHRPRQPRLLLAGLVCALLALAGHARAQPGVIVADLSNHLIAITTAFAGTEVLLFGTVEEADDVVVVVRGPNQNHPVRSKERVLGIWVNTDSVTFEAAPSFYALASSRPPEEILSEEVRRRHNIGLDMLELRPVEAEGERAERFREGLIRNKQRRGLYGDAAEPLLFLGPQLFRTTIPFPANVPPGRYQVEMLAIRDGEVVAAQTNALFINKVGLEANIYDFAHYRSEIYGLVAILAAIASGWTAAAVFRKT